MLATTQAPSSVVIGGSVMRSMLFCEAGGRVEERGTSASNDSGAFECCYWWFSHEIDVIL